MMAKILVGRGEGGCWKMMQYCGLLHSNWQIISGDNLHFSCFQTSTCLITTINGTKCVRGQVATLASILNHPVWFFFLLSRQQQQLTMSVLSPVKMLVVIWESQWRMARNDGSSHPPPPQQGGEEEEGRGGEHDGDCTLRQIMSLQSFPISIYILL